MRLFSPGNLTVGLEFGGLGISGISNVEPGNRICWAKIIQTEWGKSFKPNIISKTFKKTLVFQISQTSQISENCYRTYVCSVVGDDLALRISSHVNCTRRVVSLECLTQHPLNFCLLDTSKPRLKHQKARHE